MKFSTQVLFEKFENQIDYQDKIVLLGSCFAENIGQKFQENKFQSVVNPLGIAFNPISVSNSILRLISGKEYSKKDLHFYNELYFSFDHHTRFSGVEEKAVLSQINTELKLGAQFLTEAKHLFITFGSAWVHEYIEEGEVVANCHKLSADLFEKRLLSIEEIVGKWQTTIDTLLELNQQLNIIFTVSPVRHTKDGMVENQRSKSILIESIHRLVDTNENCSYLPVYELVMDELRDYRFYNEDLVHLSNTAVNYVWDKLVESGVNIASFRLLEKVQKINQSLKHRPQFANTESTKKFFLKLRNDICLLESKNPFLDYSEAKEELKKKLIGS